MYQHALVLGKFYPPHKGHLHLIDTAAKHSQKVTVMVCHNNRQSIPGTVRFRALQEIYQSHPNVEILSVDDGSLPQHPEESSSVDEFYAQWVSLVYEHVPFLDVVFTSEEYGDEFAQYLGIEHFLVDLDRIQVPISGTKVRANPLENWDYIPKELRYFFVNRIAIMGPESVGKSILTEKLANHFQSNFVEEWGKKVYEEQRGHLSLSDFAKIAQQRQVLEDEKRRQSNRLLFCDTEDITTYLFAKMFYPNHCAQIDEAFQGLLDQRYDLYLLLRPDCDAIQDGTREFLAQREGHYLQLKEELQKRSLPFFEIGGDWEVRLEQAIGIVSSHYNLKYDLNSK